MLTTHQVLKLHAVHLSPLHLEQEVLSQTVLIESNTTATVSYINKQVGVVSKTLNDEACALYEWAIPRSLRLQIIHQPGVNNEFADYLSCNRPHRVEPQSKGCAVSVLASLF